MKKKLRSGFTTGACAAAATKIALLSVINKQPFFKKVKVWFPQDIYHYFKAYSVEKISDNSYKVIVKKFAGDDPDITDGALIGAKVKYMPKDELIIKISGGRGVGRVTKPGLPVKMGDFAINPGPRLMIERNVKEVVNKGCVEIEIFVEKGEELAKKTLNKKLGIIGGISILGTTGIVKPISTEAWLDTIKVEMNVAKAVNIKEIVLVTGRTTENILKKFFDFKEEAYITVGDHIGFSLKEAVNKGFEKIVLGGMFGKFTKIACGEFQTHVKNSTLFLDKLSTFFKESGIDDNDFLKIIKNSITARNVFEKAMEKGYLKFLQKICDVVCENCYEYIERKALIKTILVGYKGGIIAQSIKD